MIDLSSSDLMDMQERREQEEHQRKLQEQRNNMPKRKTIGSYLGSFWKTEAQIKAEEDCAYLFFHAGSMHRPMWLQKAKYRHCIKNQTEKYDDLAKLEKEYGKSEAEIEARYKAKKDCSSLFPDPSRRGSLFWTPMWYQKMNYRDCLIDAAKNHEAMDQLEKKYKYKK